jgi:MFS family permease
MTRRWEGWLPVGGIVFAVLILVAILVAGDMGDTNREILEYYADDGNRNQQFTSFILIGFGVLAFLVFLASLRTALLRAEGEPGTLTVVVFAAGVTFSALLLAANALFVGIAESTSDDDFQLDPNLARLSENIGYTLFVSALAAAGVMIAAASILMIRTGILGAWVGWAGLVIALALLAIGFAFVPVFGLIAWVFVVSVLLLRPLLARPRESPAV